MNVKKFIEIFFDQGTCTQREIIPASSIVDIYVKLPDKKSLRVSYKIGKTIYKGTEYYGSVFDCSKRYAFLKKQLNVGTDHYAPDPICEPEDAEEDE